MDGGSANARQPGHHPAAWQAAGQMQQFCMQHVPRQPALQAVDGFCTLTGSHPALPANSLGPNLRLPALTLPCMTSNRRSWPCACAATAACCR